MQIAKSNGIPSEVIQPHWNNSAGQDSRIKQFSSGKQYSSKVNPQIAQGLLKVLFVAVQEDENASEQVFVNSQIFKSVAGLTSKNLLRLSNGIIKPFFRSAAAAFSLYMVGIYHPRAVYGLTFDECCFPEENSFSKCHAC